MKILFLIDNLGPGGKERQLVELLKGLQSNKNITCDFVIMDKNIHYKEIFDLNIKIHFISYKMKNIFFLFFQILKICKVFNPDIIHTWDHLSSFFVTPIAKIYKIYLINGSIRYAKTVKMFSKLWFYEKFTFPFSDYIIANSKAGLFSHNLNITKKHIYIYNGFDFKRLENRVDRDEIIKIINIKTKYVIIMTANFLDSKDYFTYIKASEKILSSRNDVTFLCIGDGPNQKKIKDSVKIDYMEKILFLCKQNDIESIVKIFDIGVLTSNTDGHAEGISNVIMEYMALGKPVIATDSGGNCEIIEDKISGFLIHPFDIKTLVTKIELLLNNKELRNKMGCAGKKIIEEKFNNKIMMNNYLKVYKNLLLKK